MVAAAAVALGCQRLAGLAVELAVELAAAVALWGARSLLHIVAATVGVVNHLCFYCGNSVVSETPTPLVLHLHCHGGNVDAFAQGCYLHGLIFRQRLESTPLVLQLCRAALQRRSLVVGVVLWVRVCGVCGNVVDVVSDACWNHLCGMIFR